MGGGESRKEEEDMMFAGVLPSGEQLVDAPVLFLVLSHKAFSEELAQLYGLVVEAAEKGILGKECYFELNRRFQFLKLVYKYHCAAEDEVVFLALDAEVKNVAPTYSLEHKVIDDCFSSTSNVLNHFISDGTDKAEQLQELVCSIGALQESICQHMFKEEHQVFPLLMKRFSSEEQASLVWQYICSVPIKLLQEFLPWMASLLTDYKMNLVGFLEVVVPKEAFLQEVVMSWIHPKDRFCSGIIVGIHQEGHECHGVIGSFKNILKQYPSTAQSRDKRDFQTENSKHEPDGPNPSDGVRHWHSAIIKELLGLLKELYHIKTSSCASTLASVIVQLKFVLHILMFYSNVWDHIIYPVVDELSISGSSPPYGQFFDKSQIEGLELLLYVKLEDQTEISTYVEKLCKELDPFIRRVSMCLNFLEREIFPFICDNCSCEALLWLFYSSLQMMPLGLLKQTIFWFSSHLSVEQFKAILSGIKLEYDAGSMSFISLLHDWVRLGYSGKIPIDKFKQDLKGMFSSRRHLLSEDAKKGSSSSDKKLHVQELDNCGAFLSASRSEVRASNNMLQASSVTSHITETNEIGYSSKMNRRVFFPRILRKNPSLQNHHAKSMSVNPFSDLESRPMDHVLLFHKALIKNLECLVNLSSKLAEDISLLADFRKSFYLLQLIYQTHSESEDKIAFPALETIGKLQNISHAYVIDHNLEVEQFKKTSHILEELSLFQSNPNAPSQQYLLTCLKLHDACISMHKILTDHIYREEIELFPLFKQHFSIKEQEKIVAQMLGWTRAEILQEIIPWLVASITPDEQKALICLWLKATRNTKFNEWLREWWVGMSNYDIVEDAESHLLAESEPCTLDVVLTYLSEGRDICKQNRKKHPQEQNLGDLIEQPGIISANKVHLKGEGDNNTFEGQEPATFSDPDDDKRNTKTLDGSEDCEEVDKHMEELETLMPAEHPLVMNQQELEDTIRRVSRDTTLDPQKKAYIMQNLLMSRWIVTQQRFHEDNEQTNEKEQISGQCPSYRDSLGLVFGCEHYKRNCKLLTPCCNKLYTCIRCHDEMTDHSVDRKSITKMCCMKCLVIQPLNTRCSTPSCNELSMAKYFCKICKLFDDERQIYHCPYCNLCRVGKGLGIDYFHCMTCNACMSRYLKVHACREKCFEDNCPICHEYIFTSSAPVKALPCGHLMHSSCFQEYTCSNYICPVCSKSLGDMQVYFQMLDALLAEEKIPDEYSEQTQVILCNDCEKKGTVPFHWLYHKCLLCGSYNTRLV